MNGIGEAGFWQEGGLIQSEILWNKFTKVREFHFNSIKSHGIFLFVGAYNKQME